MKKLITLIIVASLALTIQAQDITNTPGTDGDFVITSTTGGILIPTMTETQRDAIGSPATGLMIYQTDNTPGFYYYNGSSWVINGDGTSTVTGLSDLSDAEASNSNVFLGLNAGINSTGKHNVATGLYALEENTTGENNAAFGESALGNNVTGHENVAIGVSSLTTNTIGSYNVALGYGAGHFSTGEHNILIGKATEPSSTTVSNELNIGNTIYGTGLYGTGKVGIGSANNAPSSTLDVDGSVKMDLEFAASDITLDDTHYTIVCGAGITVTLPTAAGIAGRIYIIKNIQTDDITVDGHLTENIDDNESIPLAQWKYVKVQSTDAGWIIIGQN